MSRILPFNKIYQLAGKFVNVEFGNPKKIDCAGLGICKVEEFAQADTWSTVRRCGCTAIASLSYSPLDRRVIFQFRRRDIKSCAFARQFKRGVFRVETPYHFSPQIIRSCHLPSGAVINQGTYNYQEKSGYLRLQLPLRQAATPGLGLFTNQQISATI